MKKISLLAAIPLAIFPTCMTSCSNSYEPSNIVKKLIAENFSSSSIELAQASSVDDAIEKLNTYFISNDVKKNEILFDCFNFLGQKKLMINEMQFTGDDSCILDYLNNGTCEINCQYNISYDEINDNKFSFNFQGYVTIVYTKSLTFTASTIAKGDWIQYVYDIEGNQTFCNLSVVDNTSQYDVNITYSLPSSSQMSYAFGFIKAQYQNVNIPTIVIDDMSTVNYANHPYVNGYYFK